jgi:hypothetical protein
VALIRECLATLDEQPHHPLEFDTHCTTNATQCNPFHQQAFDARTFVLRDEGWLETLDKLASSIMAVMVLFAIMNVTIFLLPGCLAPWPHLANAHRWLLTAVPCVSVSVNRNTALLHEQYMNSTTVGAVLFRQTEYSGLQILTDFGAAGRLPLLRTVKLLRGELAVPGQDGIRLHDAGHVLQRLLAQLLPDLGEHFAFAITKAYLAFNLRAQDTILCHQVLVPQEDLLVRRFGDICEQFLPVHMPLRLNVVNHYAW